jgi:molecular chaperone GrpE (heat shock protein)
MNKKSSSDHSHSTIETILSNLDEKNNLQMGQLIQLSQTIYQQNRLITESEKNILGELKRFHTSAPLKGMAVVFQKFFRDLAKVLTSFDELLAGYQEEKMHQDIQAWMASVLIIRSMLEATLTDWGLEEIKITPGVDLFNPEIHEAVGISENQGGETCQKDTIMAVVARGWKLQNYIIQYPKVLVN